MTPSATTQRQEIEEDLRHRIEAAFARVFGHPERRTEDQTMVLDVLRDDLHGNRNIVIRDITGKVDTVATSLTAGRFEVWRAIEERIRAGISIPEDEKKVVIRSGLRKGAKQ